MMDIRKLKELVRLMVENDLTELDLRDKDEQATVRRQTAHCIPQIVSGAGAHSPGAPPAQATGGRPGAGIAAAPAVQVDDPTLIAIESPMVGTFYTASGPDKPALAAVGTIVDGDSVVCLIEAMKIFNEIKAEVSGTIVKVLVKNGQAVEFGQKLFLVRAS